MGFTYFHDAVRTSVKVENNSLSLNLAVNFFRIWSYLKCKEKQDETHIIATEAAFEKTT